MALSKEILNLLDLIDKIDGIDIDYLEDFLRCEVESGSLSEMFKFLDAEQVKELKTARGLVHKRAKAKQGPSRELSNELIETLDGILHNEGDGILNEHFTRLELQRIPGIVTRWKKLTKVPIVLFPSDKVTEYMREATLCYLYGRLSAAAVLCRAVLEFALEEEFGDFGGIPKPVDRADEQGPLQYLINSAWRMKILSDKELVTDAHRIRRVGRNAIHKSACTEGEALEAIKNTGKILTHIYGRTGQRGR